MSFYIWLIHKGHLHRWRGRFSQIRQKRTRGGEGFDCMWMSALLIWLPTY